MGQAEQASVETRITGLDEQRQRLEARIRRYERSAGTSLWAMVLFLLASFAAFNNFSLLPEISPELREILGAPPPEELISLALVIYAFSGIVRTLARMTRNVRPYLGLMHATFFVAFYLFYFLSNALPGNFWAVFIAGISVMGLENYYLWAHSSAAIRKDRALLQSLDGGGTSTEEQH